MFGRPDNSPTSEEALSVPLDGLWQWFAAIPAEGKLVLALALLLGWLYLSARYGGLIAWLDRHMPDSEPRRWR